MIPWGSNGSQSKNSAAEAGYRKAALLSPSDVPVDAVVRWPSTVLAGAGLGLTSFCRDSEN